MSDTNFPIDLQLFAEDEPAPVEPVVDTPAQVETVPPVADNSMTRDEFKSSSSFLKQFEASQPVETEQKPVIDETAPEESETDTPAPPDDTTPEDKKEEEPEEPATQAIKLPDGRELTVEQIAELEKGSMMQADYTKKTQALAEERRLLQQEQEQFKPYKEQADKALELYRAFERDPIGAIQQLTEYYDRQGICDPKTPEQLEIEDRQRALDAKEQTINQKSQTLEQQEMSTKFNQYMDSIADKYKGEGFDKEKVSQYMIQNSIYNAETAWKAMNHDPKVESLQKQIDDLNKKLESAKTDSVNEYVKTKTVKSGSPLPLGASGSSGTPPVQVNKPATMRDAKLSALSRFGNS